MRSMMLITCAVLTLSAVAVYAQQPAAEPAPAATPQTRFMIHMREPQTRTEAIARAKTEFAALDKNKDGFVTREELPQMPAGAHMMTVSDGAPGTPPAPPAPGKGRAGAPDRLFALMDKNGDGTISRAEFDAFYGHGNVQQTTTVTQGADGKEMRQERVIVMHTADGAPAAMSGMPPLPEPGRMAGMMFAMRFDKIDANHDGKVSEVEAVAAATARFDRLDTNHDGTLTAEERSAGMPRIVTRTVRIEDDGGKPLPPLDR